MAKIGDSPDRKDKPKSKPRAARPSFAPPAAPAASSAWVYRSDAPAAKPAAAAKAVAPVAKAVVVTPAAKPAVTPPASPRRRLQAPVVAAPAPAARASRVVHALDVVTLPIAVSLMAVLAPMRWLLGSSRH
jgi:hypothetical protein